MDLRVQTESDFFGVANEIDIQLLNPESYITLLKRPDSIKEYESAVIETKGVEVCKVDFKF